MVKPGLSAERPRSAAARPEPSGPLPAVISVRGARHNKLQNIDVDLPLWQTVAVVEFSAAGVLAEIESLGLDLVEIRKLTPPRRSPEPGVGQPC
jgi:excinuclease UvrABC ATPase subunit